MGIAEDSHRVAEELTVPIMLRRNAERYGELPALSDGQGTLTWARLRSEVGVIALGLAELGLSGSERMLIMMSSRAEHWIVDLAAVHLKAVPCTAYATLASEQIRYVARHSGATVVVLEGEEQLARWRPVLDDLPALRTVIMLDANAIPAGDDRFVSWTELHRLGAEADGDFDTFGTDIRPDDPVAMMYTSGTTGDPKAVVLSHRNVVYEAAAVEFLAPTQDHPASVAYLPLAHIAERELSIYGVLYKAGHVTICPDPKQVLGALNAVRPPVFFGVPRIWEKMAAGVRGALASADEAQQAAIGKASELALRAYDLRAAGKPVPDDLAAQLAEADSQVLRPIRAMLGLDRLTRAGTGSAPVSVDVLRFLAGLGIDILEVWGMSETTGSATANTPGRFKPGSVGRPIPGVEIRIAEDGEIFVRGPVVFLGYLRADGEIERATDEDGWLATGDIGTIDDDGFLTITDRKKELIITSAGKNIPPTKVEGLLRSHPLVAQAVAIGDRRPYVVALVVLDEETVPGWAAAHGLETADLAELAEHPVVRAELDTLVASANDQLARAEQIKRYHVLPVAWSAESGELTPTLKLRRKTIAERYTGEIEALYA